jgi:hypothetical protein
VCLRCTGNTAGDQCEVCAPGFFGDAITAKNCTACACHALGSTAPTCDSAGVCACIAGVQGAKCDTCTPANMNNAYIGVGSVIGPQGCQPCDACTTGLLAAADTTAALATAENLLMQQNLDTMTNLLLSTDFLIMVQDALTIVEGEAVQASLIASGNFSSIVTQLSNTLALLNPNGTFATALDTLMDASHFLAEWPAALVILRNTLASSNTAVLNDRTALQAALGTLLSNSQQPMIALNAAATAVAQSQSDASALATTCAALTAALSAAQAEQDMINSNAAALQLQLEDQSAAIDAGLAFVEASDILPGLANATATFTQADTNIAAAAAMRAMSIEQRLAGTFSVHFLNRVVQDAAAASDENALDASDVTARCHAATAALLGVNASLVTVVRPT